MFMFGKKSNPQGFITYFAIILTNPSAKSIFAYFFRFHSLCTELPFNSLSLGSHNFISFENYINLCAIW